MTNEVDTTAIVVASPLDLIEALDDSQIITALQGASDAAVKTWAYQFRQDGSDIIGMSIDGVQEAAREMARRGDVIDQEWVRLDRDTEREAYFSAKAVRFAVSPDGQRVQMDSAIRSKRVEKFTKLREPKMVNGLRVTEVPNRYWYEVGVAKVARNAVEALLPEGIKQWMMETAKKGGNVRDVSKEKRTAAQHATAPADGRASTPAAGAKVNPKQVLNDILKQVKARQDWPAIATEAASKWPRVVGDDGGVMLSEATEADVTAMTEWFGAKVGQAEMIDG